MERYIIIRKIKDSEDIIFQSNNKNEALEKMKFCNSFKVGVYFLYETLM